MSCSAQQQTTLLCAPEFDSRACLTQYCAVASFSSTQTREDIAFPYRLRTVDTTLSNCILHSLYILELFYDSPTLYLLPTLDSCFTHFQASDSPLFITYILWGDPGNIHFTIFNSRCSDLLLISPSRPGLVAVSGLLHSLALAYPLRLYHSFPLTIMLSPSLKLFSQSFTRQKKKVSATRQATFHHTSAPRHYVSDKLFFYESCRSLKLIHSNMSYSDGG